MSKPVTLDVLDKTLEALEVEAEEAGVPDAYTFLVDTYGYFADNSEGKDAYSVLRGILAETDEKASDYSLPEPRREFFEEAHAAFSEHS